MSQSALLVIDFINPMDFSGAHRLAAVALRAARATAALKIRAQKAGRPVIYINDNFGRWRSNFLQVIAECERAGGQPSKIAALLRPGKTDYFVLKPRHSGFFLTPLEALLGYLRARHVILSGLLTDSCVLFTANDAYLRGYKVTIATDCVATFTPKRSAQALDYMRRTLKADVRSSHAIRFSRNNRRAAGGAANPVRPESTRHSNF